MEHQMLVRTALVELAAGLGALCLLVAAVACWRCGDAVRRLVAALCIAGCVAAGMVAVHSHARIATERVKKCNATVHRGLCDGLW
jgi:hypothetical protein